MEYFQLLIIPFFIFFARVLDVSMSTIRIMFLWAGNKWYATLLGFFEALIWIVAIGQIMQDITNWTCYVAYAAGFAAGTFTGMLIEEKVAYGKSIIRIITKKPALELIDYLKNKKFGVTSVEAEGHSGRVHVIYSIIDRRQVKHIAERIRQFNPNAFYTVESVKFVSEVNNEQSYAPRGYRNLFLAFKRK